MKYTYEYQGTSYTIDLERRSDGQFQATIGDNVYQVQASQMQAGAWLIQDAQQRHFAHVSAHQEARYVHLNGIQYQVSKVDSRRKRANQAKSGDLSAEMPGQVLDLRVAVGDTVEAGQVLLVLEAMKMEIRVTAPQAGIVSKIHVSKGAIVERGQELLEIQAE